MSLGNALLSVTALGHRGDVMTEIDCVEILPPRHCGILLQIGFSMLQIAKGMVSPLAGFLSRLAHPPEWVETGRRGAASCSQHAVTSCLASNTNAAYPVALACASRLGRTAGPLPG
jgi:hypothetical protein